MTDTEVRLVRHHVGARSGALDETPAFQSSFVNILYDADPSCLDQVQERMERVLGESHSFPYCLGEKSGAGVLNINYDPYTNSVLDLSEQFENYCKYTGEFDYVYGQTISPAEKLEVEIRALDDLVTPDHGTLPPPDFLSVDTEGSAYQVLSGATETLRSGVVGVVAEVEFCEFWRDQKLFGDHCKFLDALGFDFFDFIMQSSCAPIRASIGLRGKGRLVCAEALFLRRRDSLREAIVDEDLRWLKFMKLAFVAISFGHVEYGMQVLDAARTMSPSGELKARAEQSAYVQFLHELSRAADAIPIQYPPSFVDKYSLEQSRARSLPSNIVTGTGFKARVKTTLLAYPTLLEAVRRVRRGGWRLRGWISDTVGWVGKLSVRRYSPFEQVLVDHDLKDVAELVRVNRLAQQRFAVGG